jgi:hypothetical protein
VGKRKGRFPTLRNCRQDSNGTDGLCPQSSSCTWSSILSGFPDATISGAVVLKAGSGWSSFDGNVDGLTIGVNGSDTTYDFENLPATKRECMQGGWQSFGAFKSQGDCVSYVATGGRNQPG